VTVNRRSTDTGEHRLLPTGKLYCETGDARKLGVRDTDENRSLQGRRRGIFV